MDTPSKTPLVGTLTDFDNLLKIAKSYGVTQLRIGDIEVVIPPSIEVTRDHAFTQTPNVDVDAEAFNTYKTL